MELKGLSIYISKRGIQAEQHYSEGNRIIFFQTCEDSTEVVLSNGSTSSKDWAGTTIGEMRQWLKDRAAKAEADKIQAEALQLPKDRRISNLIACGRCNYHRSLDLTACPNCKDWPEDSPGANVSAGHNQAPSLAEAAAPGSTPQLSNQRDLAVDANNE